MVFKDTKLTAEFNAWLRSRPEWAALAAAIRKGREPDEPALVALAVAAGCENGQQFELHRLRQGALRLAPVAKKLPALQKQMAALCEAARKAGGQMEAASAADYESAKIDAQIAAEAVQKCQGEVAEAEVAVGLVEAARNAGVI